MKSPLLNAIPFPSVVMLCKAMDLNGLGWAGADGEEVGTGGGSERVLKTGLIQEGSVQNNAVISQAWLSREVCEKERGCLCVKKRGDSEREAF